MKRLILCTVAALGLSACGESSQIKNVIKDHLVDADSAKFRGEVKYSADKKRACIEVNSKNKMGGYTGFNAVVVDKIDGKWDVPMSMDSADCDYWLKLLAKVEK